MIAPTIKVVDSLKRCLPPFGNLYVTACADQFATAARSTTDAYARPRQTPRSRQNCGSEMPTVLHYGREPSSPVKIMAGLEDMKVFYEGVC